MEEGYEPPMEQEYGNGHGEPSMEDEPSMEEGYEPPMEQEYEAPAEDPGYEAPPTDPVGDAATPPTDHSQDMPPVEEPMSDDMGDDMMES